jgi:hypothetical protein
MTNDKTKFILLHVSEKESSDFLQDALTNQGVERGLFMRTTIGSDIFKRFDVIKERGYFPVGVIVDPKTQHIEFLFNRHPNQTDSMKLAEFKSDNPLKL